MRLRIVLALGGLALAAPSAGAQAPAGPGACGDIVRMFTRPPTLGEWSELRMDRKKDKGKKPVMMRVGFVDREERDGVMMYRMQLIMTYHDGKRHILQMLAPWGPRALDRDYDTELVMKTDDQQAMILPIAAAQNAPGMRDVWKECDKLTYVGRESVSVPAGTFDTRHYTGPEGDSWVDPGIPGWRMAKMVTAKGDTMVLTATGDGATNEITETPVDMKAMMRGRGLPQRNKDKAADVEEAK
jgi:hypothetical protein